MISSIVKENLKNASWIRKMFVEGERLKKELGAENVFDYSLGNPYFEPPKSLIDTLKEIVNSDELGTHRYMDNLGYVGARQKIAESYVGKGDHTGVMMTVGAAGGINVFLRTVLEPGDEVVIIAPYFAEYTFYIANNNGKRVVISSDPNTFEPKLDELASVMSEKTRVVIVNTPHNPTGAVYSEQTLKNIADILVQAEKKFGREIYLISDEPYYSIIYDGVKLPFIHDIYKHSVIISSFSKSLGLAGERIGYISVNPDIEDLQEIMSGLSFAGRTLGFVNCPAIWQRVIEKAPVEPVDINLYDQRRKALLSVLADAGMETAAPKGAFYLFPKSLEEDDIAFVMKAKEFGILLVPGSGFGYPGHVRLSYCVDLDMIERSREAFKKLGEYYKAR
ncbi:MAG: pyridoxal phosphate-dependent aminotransferase [Bacillota bacterium]|nr:pyridoxal phosphate-dependent aminotransferase [Bacillota bacterium]